MALTDESSTPQSEVLSSLLAVLLGNDAAFPGAHEVAVARARELVICEELLLFLRGMAASIGFVTYDQIWRLSNNRGLFRGIDPRQACRGPVAKGQLGQ